MTAGEVEHTRSSAEHPGSSVEGAPTTIASAGSVAAEGAERGAPPTWHPDVLDGPLSVRGLLRVDEALRLADASTGLVFSVYIGELAEPTRETAESMHATLAEPDRSVLIAISPNQRLLEIVTGSVARRRILDRDAKLAALSMSAAFAGGDLAGGIVAGLAQLADHAGRY